MNILPRAGLIVRVPLLRFIGSKVFICPSGYRGGYSLSPHSLRNGRSFHLSPRLEIIKPFLLADIGEGIRECEVIQWFVEPGARVEQFDKLCEVQSDKASVEITSRFDGVIRKLHYEAGDMAIVGKPLVDIDTEIELNAEESVAEEDSMEDNLQASNTTNESSSTAPPDRSGDQGDIPDKPLSTIAGAPGASASQKPLTLATPAVRRLSKELDIPIETVRGSGPGGRIQKQDLIKGLERLTQSSKKPLNQTETRKPLTPIQSQMYKTMTRSLSLPQFLFSDSYDFTALSSLRRVLNEHLSQKSSPPVDKVSYFPLLVKAVSQTLVDYPILNARLDEEPSGSKPQIVYRSEHNIGVAIDSPSGLVVPVIRSVQNLSIFEISAEVQRFSKLAQSGSLSSSDLSGGTITVSNIGTIGGTTTTPMLVEGQLAILGIGKAKTVPGFDKHGRVVPRQETVLSWCADHRVIDGATLARMAGAVGKLIDEPGALLTDIR